MKYFTLNKSDLIEILNDLINRGYLVYGPTQNEGYIKIHNGNDINLDGIGVNKTILKQILYPNRDVLYEYNFENSDIKIIDHLNKLVDQHQIIVGLRACDLRAIEILDRVFMGKYEDIYYKTRRENTILIGVQCTDMGDKCFCYFVGSGPEIRNNYDLSLTDIGSKYLVEAGSIKGFSIVKEYRDYFLIAKKEDISLKKEVVDKLIDKFKKLEYHNIDDIIENLDKLFESRMWSEYAERCLACGRCNYVCPTCNCFDIIDVINDDFKGGKRVRIWDSCHFLGFTRVTSGEIFRRERRSRIRQRIYHKYYYSIYEIGDVSCVGCGRCIEVCKANIDIRDILSKEVIFI